MAFTMHSHSGQFCPGHAKDQLEAIVQHAISLGYTTMGLTEHMPRIGLEDLYPEELDDPEASLAALLPRHEAYLAEAQRLQRAYAPRIHILVGFEGEWLRPDAYAPLVASLAAHPAVDYFVGSLHHVAGVPIDYDGAHYARAVAAAEAAAAAGQRAAPLAGSGDADADADAVDLPLPARGEEAAFARYYDEQYAMLRALRPRVVGHFDVVRLLSAAPGRDVRAAWPATVWPRVARNLRLVARYGGWLECNTSALRKGLAEPYPARPVAEEWLRLGGRFTLSDDSHGRAHLGTHYAPALDYLAALGVTALWTLRRDPHPGAPAGAPKAKLVEVEVPLESVRAVVSKWT
ncbi:histidinol-phosphatase [Durotheca rogersii]|uniref:histidinol-phosphatase n=1 Tax=Durotheca rogersii TaxID=419775 RepID=UPI00221EDA3D|nr:histidinol-phosphatase [Durotheca rogersii]KAI5862004.1 histidinol-phosphatase [Durotheca rogersii]